MTFIIYLSLPLRKLVCAKSGRYRLVCF
jgi:hypothetical protein